LLHLLSSRWRRVVRYTHRHRRERVLERERRQHSAPLLVEGRRLVAFGRGFRALSMALHDGCVQLLGDSAQSTVALVQNRPPRGDTNGRSGSEGSLSVHDILSKPRSHEEERKPALVMENQREDGLMNPEALGRLTRHLLVLSSRGSHSRGRPQLRGQGPLKFCRRCRPTWGHEPCRRRPKVLRQGQLFANSAMLRLRAVKMAFAQAAQAAIPQSSPPPPNFWVAISCPC